MEEDEEGGDHIIILLYQRARREATTPPREWPVSTTLSPLTNSLLKYSSGMVFALSRKPACAAPGGQSHGPLDEVEVGESVTDVSGSSTCHNKMAIRQWPHNQKRLLTVPESVLLKLLLRYKFVFGWSWESIIFLHQFQLLVRLAGVHYRWQDDRIHQPYWVPVVSDDLPQARHCIYASTITLGANPNP